MTKWGFLVIRTTSLPSYGGEPKIDVVFPGPQGSITEELDFAKRYDYIGQLGLDGWELVSVEGTADGMVSHSSLWFKRHLSDVALSDVAPTTPGGTEETGQPSAT
jgi:hypothetical protein